MTSNLKLFGHRPCLYLDLLLFLEPRDIFLLEMTCKTLKAGIIEAVWRVLVGTFYSQKCDFDAIDETTKLKFRYLSKEDAVGSNVKVFQEDGNLGIENFWKSGKILEYRLNRSHHEYLIQYESGDEKWEREYRDRGLLVKIIIPTYTN